MSCSPAESSSNRMSLLAYGIGTSQDFEITSITRNGIWVFVNNKEYFIPFNDYPELKLLPLLNELLRAKFSPPDHIYWENADIDIELEASEEPGKYLLKYT